MADLDLATDPFNTSLDRAMLGAGYSRGADFNRALDELAWGRLTPAEQREMYDYHCALADNCQWISMIFRHEMQTHRYAWSDAAQRWCWIEWTPAEKAAERAAFQGKAS